MRRLISLLDSKQTSARARLRGGEPRKASHAARRRPQPRIHPVWRPGDQVQLAGRTGGSVDRDGKVNAAYRRMKQG